MTTAITGRLLHDLVAGTHAEGITALAVEATIDRAGMQCRGDRDMPLRCGRRRPWSIRGRADTAVPGV